MNNLSNFVLQRSILVFLLVSFNIFIVVDSNIIAASKYYGGNVNANVTKQTNISIASLSQEDYVDSAGFGITGNVNPLNAYANVGRDDEQGLYAGAAAYPAAYVQTNRNAFADHVSAETYNRRTAASENYQAQSSNLNKAHIGNVFSSQRELAGSTSSEVTGNVDRVNDSAAVSMINNVGRRVEPSTTGLYAGAAVYPAAYVQTNRNAFADHVSAETYNRRTAASEHYQAQSSNLNKAYIGNVLSSQRGFVGSSANSAVTGSVAVGTSGRVDRERKHDYARDDMYNRDSNAMFVQPMLYQTNRYDLNIPRYMAPYKKMDTNVVRTGVSGHTHNDVVLPSQGGLVGSTSSGITSSVYRVNDPARVSMINNVGRKVEPSTTDATAYPAAYVKTNHNSFADHLSAETYNRRTAAYEHYQAQSSNLNKAHIGNVFSSQRELPGSTSSEVTGNVDRLNDSAAVSMINNVSRRVEPSTTDATAYPAAYVQTNHNSFADHLSAETYNRRTAASEHYQAQSSNLNKAHIGNVLSSQRGFVGSSANSAVTGSVAVGTSGRVDRERKHDYARDDMYNRDSNEMFVQPMLYQTNRYDLNIPSYMAPYKKMDTNVVRTGVSGHTHNDVVLPSQGGLVGSTSSGITSSVYRVNDPARVSMINNVGRKVEPSITDATAYPAAYVQTNHNSFADHLSAETYNRHTAASEHYQAQSSNLNKAHIGNVFSSQRELPGSTNSEVTGYVDRVNDSAAVSMINNVGRRVEPSTTGLYVDATAYPAAYVQTNHNAFADHVSAETYNRRTAASEHYQAQSSNLNKAHIGNVFSSQRELPGSTNSEVTGNVDRVNDSAAVSMINNVGRRVEPSTTGLYAGAAAYPAAYVQTNRNAFADHVSAGTYNRHTAASEHYQAHSSNLNKAYINNVLSSQRGFVGSSANSAVTGSVGVDTSAGLGLQRKHGYGSLKKSFNIMPVPPMYNQNNAHKLYMPIYSAGYRANSNSGISTSKVMDARRKFPVIKRKPDFLEKLKSSIDRKLFNKNAH